ncbi:MAG: hypothetical protein AAGB00_05870 [Planctomycetota bacterium]
MPRVTVPSLCVPALLAACVLAGSVSAQSYKVLKPSITPREAKQLSVKVTNALGSDAAFAAGKADVDKYFKGFYFPAMTGDRPEQLTDLGKSREGLFKRYIRGAKSADAQKYLTQLADNLSGVIALGNFHPAVRYNAVLILGQLDAEYSGGGRNPTPPKPLPSSTVKLLALLERDKIKDTYIPPSLKVGALIGLSRHARFGIPGDQAAKVAAAAAKVVAQEKPPKDMKKSVHSWMKKLAAEVLVRQQAKSLSPGVQAALDKLIAKGVSLDDRCEVAGLMKLVDYSSAAGVSGCDTVNAIGRLTLDVLDEENESADEFLDELLQANRGIGAGGRGGFGGGGRNGDTGPKYERRRVLARVMQIQEAMNTLTPVLEADCAGRKDALLEPIKQLIAVSTEKDSFDQDVAKEVGRAHVEVKRLVSQWMPVEEPEEEVDPLAEDAEALSLAE